MAVDGQRDDNDRRHEREDEEAAGKYRHDHIPSDGAAVCIAACGQLVDKRESFYQCSNDEFVLFLFHKGQALFEPLCVFSAFPHGVRNGRVAGKGAR